MNPGEQPFYKQPISLSPMDISVRSGAGVAIDKATKLPGVPPLSTVQAEAIQLYRDIVADLAVDIPFKPGDIQLLSNYVTLHSRRGFQDWPNGIGGAISFVLDQRRQWPSGCLSRFAKDAGDKASELTALKMTAPLEAEAAAA